MNIDDITLTDFTASTPGIPFITPATINGVFNQFLTANITASESPTSYGNSTALPPGLTLNATTGAISGTPTSAGNTTVTVTATNGNGTGNGTLTFLIAKANQTITGVSPSLTRAVNDPPYSLNAATNSGLPISYTSSNASVASIAPNGTVTINAQGQTTLTASQVGDANWNAAANVTQNLTVTAVAQPPAFGTNTFTATVGVAFSNTVNATNFPTIYGNSTAMPPGLTLNATTGAITGTPTAADNFTVNATISNSAGNATGTLSFTIAKGNQTISGVASSESKLLGDAPYSLNATINSGLPISYTSSNESVATVSNEGTVTILAGGTTILTASQAGDDNWNPAPNATQTLTVTVPIVPTINVTPDDLSGFSTKENAASANQTITVSGTDLEEAITVTSSPGYEISTNGNPYSSTLRLIPNQSNAPVARAATIIASDTAADMAYADGWASGDNGGSGFAAWQTPGSDGAGGFNGFFVGAANATFSNHTTLYTDGVAFSIYAGGDGAFQDATRPFLAAMLPGDVLTHSIAFSFDNGNKGFSLLFGDLEAFNFNINDTGYSWTGGNATITPWPGVRESGVVIHFTITRTSTGFDYSISSPQDSNLTRNGSIIAPGIDALKYYISGAGGGDGGNLYFNNLAITASAIGGNLTDTTVFVRLAANGTPGPANGNLTLTSANATTRTVALSGTVLELTEPEITSRTINGTVGIPLNESIGASNDPTSHAATGTIPPGVSFNATTGIFSGTPTTADTYPVEVTATNADGTSLPGTLTFVIAKGTPAITTPPTASTIFSGQTLANAILSEGSASINGTFAFTDPSIAPPVGNSTQSVTFTPTDSANWNTATVDISVTVSPEPPGPPEFPTEPIVATVGDPLSISANIGNGPTSYSGNLPDGLTLNPLTGQIEGTPFAAGTFSVPVTATNIKGSTAGNLTFQIAKGTPTLVTAPLVVLYSDEILADTVPLGGLANIAGEFAFANPEFQPADGGQVDVNFTPFDLENWEPTVFQIAASVGSLPVYGLTISTNLSEIDEGDIFSEARIRITHNGTTSRPITVNFTATPAALQGDMSGNLTFENLPASVTIPAGSNSTAFFVRAINDQLYTGNRTVTLTGSGRFLGANSYTANLTILDDETAFTEWSNGLPPAPELIRDYALGGAAIGQQSQLPVLGMNATHMSLDALVRTDDPKLTYRGEWTTDLQNGPWAPVLLQTPTGQNGLGNIFFSIPIEPGETKKFLRLKVTLDE